MNPDTVTWTYQDCGCQAKWSGDELTIRPCDGHRATGIDTMTHYAGPPTLIEPPPIGRPNYGDN